MTCEVCSKEHQGKEPWCFQCLTSKPYTVKIVDGKPKYILKQSAPDRFDAGKEEVVAWGNNFLRQLPR